MSIYCARQTNRLADEQMDTINERALEAIRQSSDRVVVIGGRNWASYLGLVGSGGWPRIKGMAMLDDPHLMVKFHYYDPTEYTWGSSSVWPSADRDQYGGDSLGIDHMKRVFDKVAAWRDGLRRTHALPVFLNEFGVVTSQAHNATSRASMLRWYAAVHKYACTRHGFALAAWDTGVDFCLYGRDGRDSSASDCALAPRQFDEGILAALGM